MVRITLRVTRRPLVMSPRCAVPLVVLALGGCVGEQPPGDPTHADFPFERIAPPIAGSGMLRVVDFIWARGDTVAAGDFVSLDRRRTWRQLESVDPSGAFGELHFVDDTTLVKAVNGAYHLYDLAAGTRRGLAGARSIPLAGDAVSGAHLYHLVDERPGQTAPTVYRIDLADPDSAWETAGTLPLRTSADGSLGFLSSLHATAEGDLVAALTYGLFASTDDGATWSVLPEPVSSGVAAMRPVVVDHDGAIYVVQDFHTVRSTDFGESWTSIHHNLPSGTRWDDFEVGDDGHLYLPRRFLRSTDQGDSWSPFLDLAELPGLPADRAYVRGGDIYVAMGTAGNLAGTLAIPPDGTPEVLAPREPDAPGGGFVSLVVPVSDGTLVGLYRGNLVRHVPGSHAWRWERAWTGNSELFSLGGDRLLVNLQGTTDEAHTFLSVDGGATWSDGARVHNGNGVAVFLRGVVALPDRWLAFGGDCGIVRFQSFDEGETWETAPAEPPVTDLDGSLFGRFPPDLHALLATSDGTIFGYAEETFYSNPDCFRGEVRAVSSDDGGASWQAFADDPMTWPVALTLDEDLVTAEYVRGEERVLLRRLEWEARRWRLIGEPTLDGEPIYRAGFAPPQVRHAVDADGHLVLMDLERGALRSREPLP